MTHPFKPDWSIHPGVILRDFLDDRGISQSEMSRLTGISRQNLNSIIQGRAGIGVETALSLEGPLGVSAEFWITLNMNHRLWVIRNAPVVISDAE